MNERAEALADYIAVLRAKIDRLRAVEIDLRAVIEKAANAWLEVEGVPWEGDLGDAVAAGVREIERLRAVLAENTECLCGCPLDEHESYDEDGISCENEEHECIPCCPTIATALRTLRADLAAAREREGKLREAFTEAVSMLREHHGVECGSPCRVARAFIVRARALLAEEGKP